MTATPYADEAPDVLASGLGSPLPVPYGQKQHPPKGYTGHDGAVASGPAVYTWVETHAGSNIALRLADGVVGIDVDAYKPTALATLAAFEAAYSELPKTIVSTSRDDGTSGIRLYRVAEGLRWPSALAGGGVEVIHPDHRYAMWKGSLHPEGRTYRLNDWRTGEEGVPTPKVDELPYLTERQQAGLQALLRVAEQPLSAPYSGPAYEALTEAHRATVDAHVSMAVQRDLDDLRAAQSWSEGYADELGRGWEKLTADKAQTLRTLLAEGWSGLEVAELRRRFLDAAPHDGTFTRAAAEAKWASQTKPATGKGRITPPVLGGVDFWERRESLRAIHGWARARMASPWAVLGAALARVPVTVPPNVVLPATIGSQASLNLFVALVASSGVGKGAAMGTAKDAVIIGSEIFTREAGSGEGLVKQYAHREKSGIVRDRDAVLFDITEVDTLASMSARQGSNLLPVMRKAWSGELLGFAYADPTKDIPLEAHTYRLCAVVGVQPERAGGLLAEADGGTPQRFVWLPAIDPDMPRRGPKPAPWVLAEQDWPSDFHGRIEIPLPTVAVETIEAAHLDRQRGQTDALDGHALLCRTKVMVALALLDGRRVPTEEDWALSGQVMEVSDRTRSDIEATLSKVAERSAISRGRVEGVRAAVAEDAQHAAKLKRVRSNLLAKFGPEWQSLSDLRKRMAQRDRTVFNDAIELLVNALDIEVAEVDGGRRGRLRS